MVWGAAMTPDADIRTARTLPGCTYGDVSAYERQRELVLARTWHVLAGIEEGDHRVHLVRLDPATGRLRLDTSFRDEATGTVGVDFNRASWPHGPTGPARPAGLLFIAELPTKED